MGILYSRDASAGQLVGYADSDYNGDLDGRRSTTWYIFTLSGSPISWNSTLQSSEALSNTEVEYMAAGEAAKEAIWLRGVVDSFGVTGMLRAITIHSVSQSAIYLAKNPVFHKGTKHIETRYYKIREWIEDGKRDLQKIDTSENLADMLTKVIPAAKFKASLDFVFILNH